MNVVFYGCIAKDKNNYGMIRILYDKENVTCELHYASQCMHIFKRTLFYYDIFKDPVYLLNMIYICVL